MIKFWSVVIGSLAIGAAVQAVRSWKAGRERRVQEILLAQYAPPGPSVPPEGTMPYRSEGEGGWPPEGAP